MINKDARAPQLLDEGCETASEALRGPSTCLLCPFPHCIDDYHGGKQQRASRWIEKYRREHRRAVV